jgi:general secretion pathway protein K
MRRAEPGANAGQRGWALVAVLWTLAILSMMAAASQALTVTSARVTHIAYDNARIDGDIRAGVVRAILALDDPRLAARWRVDGVPQNFTFDGLAMRVSVQDTAGLIDLNVADEDTIVGLFTSAGLSADAAKTLASNISDWREPLGGDDDPSRKQGTTDAQYAAAQLGYMPHHNPFQTVDELRLVIGMTPALFARVAPALTVYSRDSDVDEQTAPAMVLSALYPGDANKVARTIAARNDPQPQAGGNGAPSGPPGIISDSGSSWGHSYRVTIAAAPNGRRIVRTAVVEPTGDPNRPYLVEVWR